MGTYGSDLDFIKSKGLNAVELVSPDGLARVLLVPEFQGRVMTSAASGLQGQSFGWISRKAIAAGFANPQFNPFGGEERFWLGPEGGPFSWFFGPGQEQIFANWDVPAVIDSEPFEVKSSSGSEAIFTKETVLKNASGREFRIGIRREVNLLEAAGIEDVLGVKLPEGIRPVAYRTANTLTNLGQEAWTKQTGMPSVWLLGMFAPSETTTVFIPYNQEGNGPVVKDDYFGEMPSGRLRTDSGFVLFTIDGKYRSKIGLSAGRSLGLIGAFDPVKGLLTILKTERPSPGDRFVNSQWGHQEDAFGGDALNAYNDGPTEDGTIMGPFFEMESSSPAAALQPGDTLVHTQTTIHLSGSPGILKKLIVQVFGACPFNMPD